MEYPIGVQDFPTLRKEGLVYVDKTDLIYQLSKKKQVFLSRPRRFGKSMVLSTLKAYFSGRKELFEGLKINEYEHEWKKYPIVYIDFNGCQYKCPDELAKWLNGFWGDMQTQYGYVFDSTKVLTKNMLLLLTHIHQQTGEPVVVLIDEYDKPLMDVLQVPEQYKANHNILRELYSAFKSANEDLKFLMLTGVTKIAKLNVFSGLNQLQDISFSPQFETLCGITEEELYSVFAEPIAQLAKEYQYTIADTKQRLKRMYDGYHFSKNFTALYNPFSLLNAFENRDFENYWISSGLSSWLVELISGSDFDLDKATEEQYTTNQLQDYVLSSKNVLPLVYQSGYLTIADMDRDMNLYRLKIPNGEVREGFYALLMDRFLGKDADTTQVYIRRLQNSLRHDNVDEFMAILKTFFSAIPYEVNQKFKNFEAYYHHTMWLLVFLLTGHKCSIEEPTNVGRIDMVVETNTHFYLFEFKVNQSAKVARDQIDEKHYADKYDFTGKEIVKVGVNFSSQTRTVDDWKKDD